MNGQTILSNYMEDMVDECLAAVLRKQPQSAGCTCSRCMARIKVEALNRLPAFYVTGKLGEVYGEYRMKEQQYHTDIMVALSCAMETVNQQGHMD